MNNRTLKIKHIKNEVNKIWVNPKAQLLENHYKFILKILRSEYPKTMETISPQTIEDIVYDTVYLDRFLRRKRQGSQNPLKKKLAKEFIKQL
jgi:hypothetical protein